MKVGDEGGGTFDGGSLLGGTFPGDGKFKKMPSGSTYVPALPRLNILLFSQTSRKTKQIWLKAQKQFKDKFNLN